MGNRVCYYCYYIFPFRFYGFNLKVPFLYKSSVFTSVTDDDLDLEITDANVVMYQNESDYRPLPCGVYQYILNDAFFEVEPANATSLLSAIKVVDNRHIIPEEVANKYTDSVLKTRTLLLRVNIEQYDSIMATTSDTATFQFGRQDIFCGTCSELTATQNLFEYVHNEYGEDFTVTSNQQLLSKHQPFCRYARSKPNLCVYHKRNYIFRHTLMGSATELELQEEEEEEYLFYGLAGEDKAMMCPTSSITWTITLSWNNQAHLGVPTRSKPSYASVNCVAFQWSLTNLKAPAPA